MQDLALPSMFRKKAKDTGWLLVLTRQGSTPCGVAALKMNMNVRQMFTSDV